MQPLLRCPSKILPYNLNCLLFLPPNQINPYLYISYMLLLSIPLCLFLYALFLICLHTEGPILPVIIVIFNSILPHYRIFQFCKIANPQNHIVYNIYLFLRICNHNNRIDMVNIRLYPLLLLLLFSISSFSISSFSI